MPKVVLGQVVATTGALHALRSSGHTPADFRRRHVGGDRDEAGGHRYNRWQVLPGGPTR